MSEVSNVTVQELSDVISKGRVDLIDVRTPLEFSEVHVPEAKNVPLDRIDPQMIMSQKQSDLESPVYLICKSGNRGSKAQQKFQDAGFKNVVNVSGGTEAWVNAGLPVMRGKKVMSLERQVRIVAGFLVFLGAMLALFVHPYLVGISAFVGAGLMFAGITDSCMMGLLLAKMPWNQVGESSAGCKA